MRFLLPVLGAIRCCEIHGLLDSASFGAIIISFRPFSVLLSPFRIAADLKRAETLDHRSSVPSLDLRLSFVPEKCQIPFRPGNKSHLPKLQPNQRLSWSHDLATIGVSMAKYRMSGSSTTSKLSALLMFVETVNGWALMQVLEKQHWFLVNLTSVSPDTRCPITVYD